MLRSLCRSVKTRFIGMRFIWDALHWESLVEVSEPEALDRPNAFSCNRNACVISTVSNYLAYTGPARARSGQKGAGSTQLQFEQSYSTPVPLTLHIPNPILPTVAVSSSDTSGESQANVYRARRVLIDDRPHCLELLDIRVT